MKKRVTAFILIFAMGLSSMLLSGCDTVKGFVDDVMETIDEEINKPDPKVEGVRGGVQEDYGVSYGEVFEYFFTQPVWTSFVTKEGVDVVEFTGNCFFRDTPVSARIQFTYEGNDRFRVTFLAINGKTQTREVLNLLLTDAFEAYMRSGR